jgi:hypothetical protein
MNIPRLRMQDAYIGGVGIKIGTKSGPLAEAYGDALARTPPEAAEELFQINAERKTDFILSK